MRRGAIRRHRSSTRLVAVGGALCLVGTSIAIQSWQLAGLGGVARATLGLCVAVVIAGALLWLRSMPSAASLILSVAALTSLHAIVGGGHPWVDVG